MIIRLHLELEVPDDASVDATNAYIDEFTRAVTATSLTPWGGSDLTPTLLVVRVEYPKDDNAG